MLTKMSDYKRLVASAMLAAFAFYNTSLAVSSTEINQNGVPFQTATTINQNGNIFNISTTTTNGAGNIGINSFGRFNVDYGDIVNLNLINSQNKLVNLIFDNSASQINGIVNSYMNGNIGGNILFANPHGFVVGEHGVFNVGSLTLMTPKEDVMKKIFDSTAVNNTNLDKLITFQFGNDNYYVGTTNDGTKQLEMVPAKITIDGKINSGGGIDIINGGRDITIGKDAELNANMSFTADENGENVVAVPRMNVTAQTAFKPAFDGGNGINLLSQNRSDNSDYLSAIVNINGKVHANGGNVIAQTEIYSVDKESADSGAEDVTASLINVKENADIQGRDVTLRALAKATKADSDLFGLDETILDYLGITNIAEFLTEQIIHLGNLQTKVTVENGAKIASTNNTKILAQSELPFNSSAMIKTTPTLALNISVFDVLNEARVKSGADITTGGSLVVQAITNMNYSATTQSTNILDLDVLGQIPYLDKIQNVFGKNGSYALSWIDVDAVNRAIIENGATLNVANDINVLASMVRDISVVTKNGFIPLIDNNRGMLGLALAVADVEATNEAIMNADADISGSLVVNADYVGKLNQNVSGSSGSPGEDGEFGMGGKIVKGIFKFITNGYAFEKWGNLIDKGFDKIGGNSKDRLNATFGKIQIAGGLNVAIDDVKNHAYIGDASNDIKPVINAQNVVVGSTLEDHKSHVISSASSKNGETSVAGAAAFNIKSLDSDAKAYGDFTLSGDNTAGAMIVRAKTDVERPSALDSLWSWFDILDIKHYNKSQNEDVDKVNSENVDAYLDNFGMGDELQEKIDQNSSLMNLLKIFDYLTPTLGAENFFQTFAQSSAIAKSKNTDTNAWAGALGVTASNINSNAELVGGSIVNIIGSNPANNNILISAETNSTLWVATSLMSLFNIAEIVKGSLLPGSTARDGNATGGSISVLVNNVDTTSIIGENAVIKAIDDATHDGVVGDVSVLAKENGQFINLAAGTSSADKSGIAGNIAVSVTPDCETKASIEEGANISGQNVNVMANKDDNWYSTLFTFSNSKGSVSVGAGTLFIFDKVESYIKGNVDASNDVVLKALYDKLFMNVSASVGMVKPSTIPNIEDQIDSLFPEDMAAGDNELMPGLFEEFLENEGADLGPLFEVADKAESVRDIAEQVQNVGGGKVGKPDAKSYAGAGTLLLNVVNDSVKAYITDNAKVSAGRDVSVTASSIDDNIEVGAVASFNGNTGGGATVGFNLNKNDVQAYIGNSQVDAKRNTNVTAQEENTLYSFSAGITQGKDKSGVGTLSLDIQMNDVTAAIKDGAKINTSEGYDLENQSVAVNATFDDYLVKGVGALSIKAGGPGEGSAIGAAIDTDASKTNVNAYIKDSDVNASKKVEVDSAAHTKLVDITAAGGVSANGGAYSGSIGLLVSDGENNAYIENSNINKTVGRTKNNADIKVSAENTYDNITVTGAVAVGTKTTAGGAMRIDVISDNINAYIKNSDINTTGDLNIVNNSVIDSIAVTASGNVSTSGSAFGGAIMLLVDDTDQKNYIENSDIVSKSAKLDSDTKFKSIAVTGGINAALSGSAVGGALYVAVADNDIDTYIKNSNITATNDISLTTDNKIDGIEVIMSGSGGSGVAASGAIGVLVNNSNSNTEIKSDNDDKNIKSTAGKVEVKGNDDIDFKFVTGSVAISTGSVSAGGSISTIVDNSNLNAIVQGVDVVSKTGVEVDAHADNDIIAVTIGGAGGSGVAAAGSISTVVMAGDVVAKVADSFVKTEGTVTVDAYDKAYIGGGTGAGSASVNVGALGISVVTGVINNEVVSAVENSRVDASGKVKVSSLAKESIGTESVPFITVAGSGAAGTSLDGVVDTMVINSTSDAHIRGTKTVTEQETQINPETSEEVQINIEKQYGVKSLDNVEVISEGDVVLYSAGGALAGGGVGGIGETVHTVVIDKDTLSQSSDTKVNAKNITSTAKEEDKFFTTLVAASGGGSAGLAGVVNTNVIKSDVKTGFKNSTLTATEKIDIKSDAKANMQTITGAVAGGGSAGIGLSVVNDVIRYNLESALDNVTAAFNELNVNAQTDNTYKFSTVSGAGGGAVGGAGVENVNYVNNEVIAYATGDLKGNKATVNAKDKVTFKDSYSGVLAGGGTAGIGATVEVNEITSTVLAYIGGNSVKVNDIDVKATGEQTFDHIVVAGFTGGGTIAGTGTALANVIETTVKAYVTDGTKIGAEGENTSKVNLEAKNTINLTEDIGAVAIGFTGGGVGATIAVNKVKNTVEAYTGNDSTIYSKDITVNAQSENNLGNGDTAGSLVAVAGAGGLYLGLAGTVMYNSVEDTVNAYVGKNNHIYLADYGKLDVKATDITKIYDGTGAVAGGAGGIGASVDYNVIENTVVACIKPDSEIMGDNADISVIADSQETLNNVAYVISGGIGALSGAVLYSSIGKKVENATYNNFSDEADRKNFEKGKEQVQEVLNTSAEKTQGANAKYNEEYNEAMDEIIKNKDTKNSKVGKAYKEAKDIQEKNAEEKAKADADPNYEYIPIEITDPKAQKLQPKQKTDSLFTKSANSGVTESDTDRSGTTSAFIDSNVKIDANNLTVNAKNSDNVKLETMGAAVGAVGIGVSIAVSDNETTTNAFIQNNANIDVNSLTLKAESTDDQHIKTLAATGGVGAGSGSSAHINSNKTTNAYINKESKIKALKDILITAVSKSGKDKLYTEALAHAYGGIGVGVSVAHTTSEGNTRIDIGEDVELTSNNGNITIKTDADEYGHSDAWAATGGAITGTGAESFATVGKDTTVNIGKDFSATVQNGKLDISSNASNYAEAESNGRAYGGVSAGGTKTRAKIDHTSGVKIADAAGTKEIKAQEIGIISVADNKTNSTTYAGAGAAVGIAGSGVYSVIDSKNNIDIGKNYDITTGQYTSNAATKNDYLSYNKSNSFGVVAFAIPFIENTINSTVTNKSGANLASDSSIVISALNEVVKAGVNGYDIYGGSGGLATGSGGYINDNVTLTTETKFGGDKASAMGGYGEGAIDISAYNIANINEKADLYSHGGIAGADMDSVVNLKATADVNVSNKEIKTKDDHITYAARNDVDIYAKSNVESYGGVAGAGGEASAIASQISAAITFEKDAHSVSGRDTNISAVSNKNLESYIYARTRGLVSALNDESNAKSQDSKANIYINGSGDDNAAVGNALIEAFDGINITAQNTSSKIKADRDSKAYQLWCIPYTGTGNKNTENSKTGGIVLNGILKSGLGFSKSLHLNINGESIDENGNVVENGKYGIYVTKEQVGTISTNEIAEDITAYENSIEADNSQFEYYINEENKLLNNYEENITSQKESIDSLIKKNSILSENINSAIDEKTNKETELANLTGAYNDISKLEGTAEDIQAYKDAYGSLGNASIDALIEASEAYYNDKTSVNHFIAYHTAKGNFSNVYNSSKVTLNESILTLQTKINALENTININNAKLINCNEAIEKSEQSINAVQARIAEAQTQHNARIALLTSEIERSNGLREEGHDVPVFSMVVDDVIVRSGNVTFNGDSTSGTHVSGNGYIHTPGENASIKIQNDSVSNMVFNDLVIGSDIKGGITANNATIDNTIHIDTSSGDSSIIKITNTVDKNDPTVDLRDNAGDMVFMGNIENYNGAVDITNYTGNVITQGGVIAKDLRIKVPNGGFDQLYSNQSEMFQTGTIKTSGDINIEAKTIDVNGLIKSGTEIKQATLYDFYIVKRDDGYYQVSTTGNAALDGEKLVESSTTPGYYEIYFNAASGGDSIKLIRAYFKPSDLEQTGSNIDGEIYLFKANTAGGNITLTGNIVNTSGNGKIELLNGYGHINIENKTRYNIVTSTLNADTNTKGVLTINDFKLSSADDSTFSGLTHASLTDDFIKNHAGTYTAQVGEDGIVTTAINQTAGNGAWGSQSSSQASDGLRAQSIIYTPGDDAYYVTKASEQVSERRYVPRSWWTEFWYGKKYENVLTYTTPEYGVAKNPITVNFVGFETPQINIDSNKDVIINSNINAIGGDIGIKSNGNILTNSLAYAISANNINLNARFGNIGEKNDIIVKPIQMVVYGDGTLTALGQNVYVNFPKTDVSNISLSSSTNPQGQIYLGADGGSIDSSGKQMFEIKTKNLQLNANSININNEDIAEDGHYYIDAKNISARAKDDIYINDEKNITVGNIVSENNGHITLISRLGSIFSGDSDSYSGKNLSGGSYTILAPKGRIAYPDKPLTFASEGVYNVAAQSYVYLDSISKMYIDRVVSSEGGVTLKANFGIIASNITDENRVYNIASLREMNLITTMGNIENIVVDTTSAINAVAGYDITNVSNVDLNQVADALSDINITQLAKPLPTEEITMDEYLQGRQNMLANKIVATQNVTLSSERGVITGSQGITGNSVTINAVGDVTGSFNADEVSIYTSAGSTVSVSNSGDLNINRIDVTNNIIPSKADEEPTYASNVANAIDKVDIYSTGNIFNAFKTKSIINSVLETSEITDVADNTPNIRAKDIKITSGGNIGDYNAELVIETVNRDSGQLYTDSEGHTYIRGVGDTLSLGNIISKGALSVVSDSTNIYVNGAEVNDNVSITSETGKISMYYMELDGDLKISTGGDVVLDQIQANTVNVDSKKATVSSVIKTDKLVISAIDRVILDTARISHLTNNQDDSELVEINSCGDIYVDNTIINGKTKLFAADFDNKSDVSNKIRIDSKVKVNDDLSLLASDGIKVDNKLTVTGDTSIITQSDVVINEIETQTLAAISSNTNITTLTTGGDAGITTINDTKIANGTVGGNFTNTSNNTTITGKLDVTGDSIITAVNDIVINEIGSKNLNIDSKTADVTKLTTTADAEINTTEDTTIADGTVGGNFTNTSENTTITGKLDVTKDANIVANNDVTVSGELNSDKNVNITAENNVKIADANIKENLNVTTKNLDIDEMKLDGNINATTDNAEINTSNDLNVGVIKGNTQTHTDKVAIAAENIKNGNGAEDSNIYAKDIDLVANNSIGTRDTSLNVNIPKDNTIAVEAGELANINTTGAKANYTEFKAQDAIISSDEAVIARNVEVDNLDLTTKSTDIDFEGKVNKRGNFRTNNKRVSINNDNLEPDYYATTQLHTSKNPFNLIIDASNDIKVKSKYVVRHNQGILINGTDFLSSMESEAIKSAELSLKNSNRKKGLIEEVDGEIYDMSTVSDYIDKLVYPDNTGADIGLITTLTGEKINESNILDVINTKINLQSLLIENDSNKKQI